MKEGLNRYSDNLRRDPWVKNLVPFLKREAIKIGKKSLICKESPPRMKRDDRLANRSLEKIERRKKEKDNNPSNWLAVFASLNYVILRIPRETRNSGYKGKSLGGCVFVRV